MLSAVTLYVVVLSCVGMVAGWTAVATNTMEFKSTQHERRKTAKTEGKDHTKFSPVFDSRTKPHADAQQDHAYFALYDPVHNETKKFAVSGWLGSLRSGYVQNFIARDSLPDKEEETRVHFRGLTAKETTVTGGLNAETGERQGLKLRQMTDGTHFIQLIYNVYNQLQDCEFLKDNQHINQFLHTFKDDVEKAKLQANQDILLEQDFADDEGEIEMYQDESEEIIKYEAVDKDEQQFRNVSFEIIQELPQDLAEWMNFAKLRRQCKENHKVLRQMLRYRESGNEEQKQIANRHFLRAKRAITMIAPGTKWCGRSHIADTYTAIGGFSKTDKCCRTHDHCKVNIPSFSTKYEYFNFRPFTISHCRCDRRAKRDLLDVMRVPGTEWCGKGGRAPRYTSLGGFSRADRCCRAHDTACPYWIGAFQEKYGLFNWRINTIMHCRCDKRFRACLKMARTGPANLVGKLFFNVVQTQCFVLKAEKVCKRWSWWGGTCQKYQHKKKAYLKRNLAY